MEHTECSGGVTDNGGVADGIPLASYAVPSVNGTCTRERRYRKGGAKRSRYDPFEMRDKTKATTDSGALLHLIKSSLGSGILAMPNAFKNGGLIFSLVGTAAIGMLCTHCVYLLVFCSQVLARRTRRPALGFAETAAAAFSTGPRRFRPWAAFAREFVNAALFCTYYFGTTVYVVLVAESFKQVADAHTPPEWHFTLRVWILGLAMPLIPLGIIRSLRLLVPFSAIATTFILVGLGCTMSWVVIGVSVFADEKAFAEALPLPDIGYHPWIAPVGQMPLFFATVLFAMEGIGTMLPIENSMRHPQRFLTARPCGVLNAAMILVVCLYSVAGFLGYLRFGEATVGSITLNLPNDWFSKSVKMMVALSILFSYGLQFCVPSEIMWTWLEPWLRKRKQNIGYTTSNNKEPTGITVVNTDSTAVCVEELIQLDLETKVQGNPMDAEYYFMRASMILGTVFIAALVPNLAPFISLIGAVFFSMLGLLCPAVIHLFAFWEHDDNDDEVSDSESGSEECLESDGEFHPVDDDMDPDDVPRPQHRRRQNSGSSSRRRKGMSRWTVAKDVAIILISLVALVFGSYASLVEIIDKYGTNSGIDSGHVVNNTTSPITVAMTTIGPGPASAFLIADMK